MGLIPLVYQKTDLQSPQSAPIISDHTQSSNRKVKENRLNTRTFPVLDIQPVQVSLTVHFLSATFNLVLILILQEYIIINIQSKTNPILIERYKLYEI